jgi:5-oxoprolinase (ATP-hydrolysing)
MLIYSLGDYYHLNSQRFFGPNFDQPLDEEITKTKFEQLTSEINAYFAGQVSAGETPKKMTSQEVALGFISVANEAMCRPIRALTQAKGYDLTRHVLACFGGAGGQHAAAIARNLGMKSIFIHRFSGILSAYGMGMADIVQEVQEPCAMEYSIENLRSHIQARIQALTEKGISKLLEQGFQKDEAFKKMKLLLCHIST